MRIGITGFWAALAASAAVHATVLGVIWEKMPHNAAASPVAPSMIYIAGPRMGEAAGRGEAANSSAGDQPARARQADQEQAALGLEPQGVDQPAPKPSQIGPILADERPSRHSRTNIEESPQSPAAPSAAPVDQGKSPFQQSDSESDPFSRIAQAKVADGRVDARFGRKVKTVRPRFGLDADQALMDHAEMSVVLRVKTNAEGRVTDADILRSSGSKAVDLAMLKAMLNWWIEPPKDAQGHPKPDVMAWKITFR